MTTKFFKVATVAIVIPAVALLSGCATRIGGNQYVAASVGESLTTYKGTVISKRMVEVNEASKLGANGPGTAVGGMTGGLVGSSIGGGHGNVAAIVGGALLGGIVGSVVEDKLGQQTAFEYTVELDNGAIKTLVQGVDIDIAVGQRILYHESTKGVTNTGLSRSRIVPFQGQ